MKLLEMFLIFFFFISFSFFFHTSYSYSMAQDHHDEVANPLWYELLSREDMVQMAGYGEDKLSTVLVTGSVECEACLHGDDQPRLWPISGASVAVKCHTIYNKKPNWIRAVTDEYGEFLVDLPSHLHAIPQQQNKCIVKVLQIPKKSKCRPAYAKMQKMLKLSSFGNSIRTYSAGRIKFQHFTSASSLTCIKKGNVNGRENGNNSPSGVRDGGENSVQEGMVAADGTQVAAPDLIGQSPPHSPRATQSPLMFAPQDYVPEDIESISGFELPQSPDSSHNNLLLRAADYAKEPHLVPPHLQMTLLNLPPTNPDIPSPLPRPHHVILNHLYMQKEKGGPSLVALGSTHRFLAKYVTVMLYKSLQK